MSLLSRIAGAAALTGILLATPALAENKKVVLSQAFQSMLYLLLYVAACEEFSTQQASTSPKRPSARGRDLHCATRVNGTTSAPQSTSQF